MRTELDVFGINRSLTAQWNVGNADIDYFFETERIDSLINLVWINVSRNYGAISYTDQQYIGILVKI